MPMAKAADTHYECPAFPQIHRNTTKSMLDSSVLALLIPWRLLRFSHVLGSKAQQSDVLFAFPINQSTCISVIGSRNPLPPLYNVLWALGSTLNSPA